LVNVAEPSVLGPVSALQLGCPPPHTPAGP
jgi:hypothetical protein